MAALRYVLLALAFGVLVTAHVALLAALARTVPRRRALFAFFFPPLAPYWGLRAQRRVASALWLSGAAAYTVLLILSLR